MVRGYRRGSGVPARYGLTSFALAALMIAGAPVGPASASPGGGSPATPGRTAGRSPATRALAWLLLSPTRSFITSGGKQTYTAEGFDAAGHDLGNVTARTTFSIHFSASNTGSASRSEGSCSNASCTARKLGRHTVTGTVLSQGHRITGTAALQVVPRPRSRAAGPVDVATNDGTGSGGTGTGSSGGTGGTGSTGGTGGTGTIGGTSTGTGGTGTGGTSIGTGTIGGAGTGSGGTGGGTSTGTGGTGGTGASGTDNAASRDRDSVGGRFTGGTDGQASCLPSTTDVSDFQVTPSRAAAGTRIEMTAKITRLFAACPLILQLGGSRLGGTATVGPDGSISQSRRVPEDARPGITTVRLAAADGRTLAEASFQVTPAPWWHRGLPRLVVAVAALLLLVLAMAALLADRARRQRRWVSRHLEVEPHLSPEHLTVDRDTTTAPTFAVRLQPHDDVGTQILTEEVR